MGNLVLKGHISYATKRKYKWVAEFGKNTCEKCAALHGQEFEEDDVPYWPHPNCRCKVEEISVVDEIESEINGCYEVIKFLAHLFRDEIKCFVERTEKADRDRNVADIFGE